MFNKKGKSNSATFWKTLPMGHTMEKRQLKFYAPKSFMHPDRELTLAGQCGSIDRS